MSEGSNLKLVHSAAAVDEAFEKIKADPSKCEEIIQLFKGVHGDEEGAELRAKVEALFKNPEPQPKAEPAKKLVLRAYGPATGYGFQPSRNPAGIPASLENALRAIDLLEIGCGYDVFHDKIIVKGQVVGLKEDALNNLENITLKVRQAVIERFGFDPAPLFTFDALRVRCLDRVFDPSCLGLPR